MGYPASVAPASLVPLTFASRSKPFAGSLPIRTGRESGFDDPALHEVELDARRVFIPGASTYSGAGPRFTTVAAFRYVVSGPRYRESGDDRSVAFVANRGGHEMTESGADTEDGFLVPTAEDRILSAARYVLSGLSEIPFLSTGMALALETLPTANERQHARAPYAVVPHARTSGHRHRRRLASRIRP